jgi:uncharacterized oligopeptide transporter (OPT) family protein
MKTIRSVALAACTRVRVGLLRHDRGDVPGWVMVTLMTAGIVAALWAFASDALQDLFSDALDSVRGN